MGDIHGHGQVKMCPNKLVPELYSGTAPPMKEIREYLEKFKGGAVKLNLGEGGIATVTLSHVEKRNALSGKSIFMNRRF